MPRGCGSFLPESITCLCVLLRRDPAGGPGDCPLWFTRTGSSACADGRLRAAKALRCVLVVPLINFVVFTSGTQCAFMEISVLEGVLIKRKGYPLERCFLLSHLDAHSVTVCTIHVKSVRFPGYVVRGFHWSLWLLSPSLQTGTACGTLRSQSRGAEAGPAGWCSAPGACAFLTVQLAHVSSVT